MSSRSGFTLIELVVSVLVLTVGLLALSAATAVIARQVSGGARMSLAASIAESRFESLRGDCSTLRDGEHAERGILERWSVARESGAVRIVDSVSFEGLRGSRRTYAFESLVPCTSTGPR